MKEKEEIPKGRRFDDWGTPISVSEEPTQFNLIDKPICPQGDCTEQPSKGITNPGQRKKEVKGPMSV